MAWQSKWRAFASLLLVLFQPPGKSEAWSRSRAIQEGAFPYLTHQYQVAAANVYPTLDCYVVTLGDPTHPKPLEDKGLSKVGKGTWSGPPYSQRPSVPPGSNWTVIKSATQIDFDLVVLLKGAGNGGWLSNNRPACVKDRTTGIDCSSFVTVVWRCNPFNVQVVANRADPVPGSTPAQQRANVLYADAMARVNPDNHGRDHIMIVGTNPDPVTRSYFAYHAEGVQYGHVVVDRRTDFNADMLNGFVPYISRTLKDSPASSVASFQVKSRGKRCRAAWGVLGISPSEGFELRAVDAESRELSSCFLPMNSSGRYKAELPIDLRSMPLGTRFDLYAIGPSQQRVRVATSGAN